jgi:hypothetical protein
MTASRNAMMQEAETAMSEAATRNESDSATEQSSWKISALIMLLDYIDYAGKLPLSATRYENLFCKDTLRKMTTYIGAKARHRRHTPRGVAGDDPPAHQKVSPVGMTKAVPPAQWRRSAAGEGACLRTTSHQRSHLCHPL